MANRNQARGTEFESSLLPLLLQYEEKAHRLGKQGRMDKGDLWVADSRFILEAKREASYAGKLSGYLTEAEREAGNASKPYGVVIHKRSGTTDPARQYVCMTFGTFLGIAYGEIHRGISSVLERSSP